MPLQSTSSINRLECKVDKPITISPRRKSFFISSNLNNHHQRHSSINSTSHPEVIKHPKETLRFGSFLLRGICSRRVEDVKMNRIDKTRSGRRRRSHRRPFIFKSSPLAEGNGVGRLTSFSSSPSPPSSTSTSSSLSPPSPYKQRPFTHSQRNQPYGRSGDRSQLKPDSLDPIFPTHPHNQSFYISRFSTLSSPSSPFPQFNHQFFLNSSVAFSQSMFEPLSKDALNNHCHQTSNLSPWANQPQISRLRSNPTKLLNYSGSQNQGSKDYQTWEISLPKCSLPILGASLA
ncbi:hypothetical protein BY996DRAFT_4589257 [Phakopsora pachyrhizi]|uniref:Expressed protein n=1 Tax=Phakopsora pachyrhizi TaxID=170000 RepID=A0AAV0AUW2_PHAPC|nr:hypothetical protein BY996DRAFT_4592188 [Phakopsora pachyrhizi]KAI8449414.1 hypothetical protein BY996DRAFT_4589257 [Phakopsora pachyrhizi]CAH7671884.1 expressed protein [Phakopsora pachyrhizi]